MIDSNYTINHPARGSWCADATENGRTKNDAVRVRSCFVRAMKKKIPIECEGECSANRSREEGEK